MRLGVCKNIPTSNFWPMLFFDDLKLIEIFCKVDDYCLQVKQWQQHAQSETPQIGSGKRGPKCSLCESEIMTILIAYHHSGFKCFKYWYTRAVQGPLRSYFPTAPSYTRFISLIPRACFLLWGLIHLGFEKQFTGIYYIDSTKLPVCDVHRISSHKVFKDIAKRGKTSTGWFFGLKLHLVVNEIGQLIALKFSPGNVADNNHELLRSLLGKLKGRCYGDKGYISKLFKELLEEGLHLFTKVRKNMKNKLVKLEDKFLLNARTLIETIFDIMKHIFDIDHTRHRSPDNALTHMLAGLAAYQFLDEKPSIYKNKRAIELLPKF